MSHTKIPLEPRPIAGVAAVDLQPLTARPVAGAGEPPVATAEKPEAPKLPSPGKGAALALLLFILHVSCFIPCAQAQWTTNLLSPTTNGGVALAYTTNPPSAGQSITFTNYGWPLATTPLPGYSQTLLSTNAAAFYLNISNYLAGWYTNAPSGMTYSAAPVWYTNAANGSVFTSNANALTLSVTPNVVATNGIFGANTWNALFTGSSVGPVVPWGTYTINRY